MPLLLRLLLPATVVLPAALVLPGCIVIDDDDDGAFAGVYDTCGRDRDCARPADGCYDVGFSDMCSLPCVDDRDCPRGGACYEAETGPRFRICYERCINDLDCPVGFFCTPTVGGRRGDAICIP